MYNENNPWKQKLLHEINLVYMVVINFKVEEVFV